MLEKSEGGEYGDGMLTPQDLDQIKAVMVSTLEEKITPVHQQMTAVANQTQLLGGQVTAVDKKTDLLGQQVTALGNKTDLLGKQVEALDGKISGVEKRLDEKITSVEKQLEEKIIGVEKKLDEKISGVEKRLTKRIENIEKDTGAIKKDLKTIINFFDRENLDLVSRVERIEKHLGLTSLP